MKLIEIFSNSTIDDNAITLRCILDRIPVIVIGNSDQEVEDFINDLSGLISFRNQLVFYTDFVEKDDYYNVILNEENDFEAQRNTFLCYPFAVERTIEIFDHFNSWIIGCTKEFSDQFQKVKEILYNNHNYFLIIRLEQHVLKAQIEGQKFPNLKIEFEKWLFQYAIKSTEIAIERMRRVISKNINLKKLPNDAYHNIMNFSFEEKELKINIIKKEINNLYQACRRSFNILNRMKSIENLNLKTRISAKTLLNTIAYEQASIERILDFIIAEWRSNYNIFLESKKISNFTDTFESLWG